MMDLKILLIILLVFAKDSEQSPDEKRLLHHLLDEYNTLERPVHRHSDTLLVTINIILTKINYVSEEHQMLSTNCWFRIEWTDINLQWNVSDFGNIAELRVPPHTAWKPDILLYNSIDMSTDYISPTNLIVTNTGSVFYNPPATLKSSCNIDLKLFPYDEHKCEMRFQSWTFDGQSLDLELLDKDGGDLSSFIHNTQWEVLKLPRIKNTEYYSCCEEPYVDVTFTIHLRRRGEGVLITLMSQFVAISAISLFGFLLPVSSKAKLFFNLAAIFSIIFMINTVKGNYSVNVGQVPFFYKYFLALIIIVLLSILASILILNFVDNSKNAKEIPRWMRTVLLKCISAILFMNQSESNDGASELDHSKDWIFAANVVNRFSLIILTIFSSIFSITFYDFDLNCCKKG